MTRRGMLALPLSLVAHAVGLAAVVTLSIAPDRLPPVRAADRTVDVMPLPLLPAGPTQPVDRRPPSVPRRGPAAPTRPPAPPAIADPVPPRFEADFFAEEEIGAMGACIGCALADGVADHGGDAVGPADRGGDGHGGGGSAPVRVGGLIREPRKIRHVAPVYPEVARAARVQGSVVLECLLTPEGRVEGVRVVSGHPLLGAAAASAVQQWLYRPTLLNGVPVSVLLTVTVTFQLR